MKHLLPLAFVVLGSACAQKGDAAATAPPPKAAAAAAVPAAQAPEAVRTYEIRQTAKLSDIPAGAKNVRFWVSIPNDDPAQKVLDFNVVSAPGTWRIVRDAERGARFLYLEVDSPKETSLSAVVDFTVRRSPVEFNLDPKKAGAITKEHRALYADEVAQDGPHMQVTPEIKKIADETCGSESNVVLQIRALQNYVANFADHYSKDPTKPKCGIGSAEDCMTNKGGCCTDLHSLFIALARARGIPSRLQMGYRAQAKNLGLEVDPGYRCWAESFVPGYGWVPMDLVEADGVAAGDEGMRLRWMNGLTERRVWLNEGRDFNLVPKQAGPRVNTMIIGYAEIDGKAARVLPEGALAPQLSRTIRCVERTAGEPAPLGLGVAK